MSMRPRSKAGSSVTAGIMQPYFFPYLGYFDHISRCDTWVVFDITQYTPKSWMTRNKILHPKSGFLYVSCDVYGSQSMVVSEVALRDPAAARAKLLGQLSHYRKHAPHYRQVVALVEQAFDRAGSDSLTAVDVSALRVVCEYLDIPFTPIIASEAGFTLPQITHPGQWALEIATLLGADHYLNPPGGRELFRPEEFAARGIGLSFTRVPEFTYACDPYQFEPHLSILDVLMWNTAEEVRVHLGKAEVDEACPCFSRCRSAALSGR